MIAILIGGEPYHLPLPAALMALLIAPVLIVRADIDLGFTALTATPSPGARVAARLVSIARSPPSAERPGSSAKEQDITG